MPHHDLGFQAEYAKSGRSSCKACKGLIAQDSLRLAIMVQSPHFDGKMATWFHFKCFWKRAKSCKNVDDIYNFHSLRWEDQERIKKEISSGGNSSSNGNDSAEVSEDFNTEYAKSGGSKCRGCEEKIKKDTLRLGKKDYESQQAIMYGPVNLWHHVDCFVDNRDELGFTKDLDPSIINGFRKIKPEDKELLYEKLGKGIKGATKRKTKIKVETPAKKVKKEETEEEKTLREQSKLLWDYRDKLTKNVAKPAMKLLLQLNGQQLPTGESALLEALADCLVFGALEQCNECKDEERQFYYTAEGYKCTGNLTEWTKCMNITKVPKRKAFKIPKEFHDVPFFKNYKFVKRERAFPHVSVSSSSGIMSSSSNGVNGIGSSEKPLKDMRFVIQGKLTKSKASLTELISTLGGVVVPKVTKQVVAVITNKAEVEKKSTTIRDAEQNDIHVVSEDVLDLCTKGKSLVKLITECSLASWGSDVEKRIGQRPTKSAPQSNVKDEKRFTKSVPAMVKMTVKGGAAVDPDSELDKKAHVMLDGTEPMTVVLGLVDIARGTNSFYKLQALESDTKMSYWLFRAWGRVGTNIGGNKVEKCGSRASVIKFFKDLYLDKTGNHWEDRKNFQKIPDKFYPLEIDYGQDEAEIKKLDMDSSNSSLPRNVQDIICMIFDVDMMKKAMLEFEIDMKKMPLGKLSKRQIQSAYSVLTELLELINNSGTQNQFVDATNRFYTAVPHDFGMKKPPMLDTKEIIKEKSDMLDNLLEIEVAYSLLKGGDSGDDPITAHYNKLKCKMEPLDHNDEEFKRLVTYTANTHGSTHNLFDLEVMDILKITREGEKQKFRPFKELPNRKLLWHGSRTTNFAGILSQGLRIAPPEAPVTGYMFGKGVYFADMVSKSANYCRTTKKDNVAIMMLCDVALGNMYELKQSEYVTKLPKGKHSTKGIGQTCPDPSGSYKSPDGVEIPMGKGIDSGITDSSLLYNEFIVYDTAQINMKYLFKMKFNYKF